MIVEVTAMREKKLMYIYFTLSKIYFFSFKAYAIIFEAIEIELIFGHIHKKWTNIFCIFLNTFFLLTNEANKIIERIVKSTR